MKMKLILVLVLVLGLQMAMAYPSNFDDFFGKIFDYLSYCDFFLVFSFYFNSWTQRENKRRSFWTVMMLTLSREDSCTRPRSREEKWRRDMRRNVDETWSARPWRSQDGKIISVFKIFQEKIKLNWFHFK